MRYTGNKNDLERNRRNRNNSNLKKKALAVLVAAGVLVGTNIPNKIIAHFDGSEKVKQADTANFEGPIGKDLERYQALLRESMSKDNEKDLHDIAKKINTQYSERILKEALNVAREKVSKATKIDASRIKFGFDPEFQKVYIKDNETDKVLPSSKNIDAYIASIANLQGEELTTEFSEYRHANGLWNVYMNSRILKNKNFRLSKDGTSLEEYKIVLDKDGKTEDSKKSGFGIEL